MKAAKQNRSQGFSDEEAKAILHAASAYVARPGLNNQMREHKWVTAAKQWTPWLCAYSGARVGEIVQLRKEDIGERDGVRFMRITPEAGTVKTGQFREVPLHPHVIEQGFLKFVEKAADGPLFYSPKAKPEVGVHLTTNRLREWLRTIEGVSEEVAPTHGWRHRFKTVGRELGVDGRILDAIQGHAAATAADNYGDVTLRAMASAIDQFPRYDIGIQVKE